MLCLLTDKITISPQSTFAFTPITPQEPHHAYYRQPLQPIPDFSYLLYFITVKGDALPLYSSPRRQTNEYRERYAFSPLSVSFHLFSTFIIIYAYTCQKDKRLKPDNFLKNSALPEMGKHGIEKYFHQSTES